MKQAETNQPAAQNRANSRSAQPLPQPGHHHALHPGHHVGGAGLPVAVLLHGGQSLRDHPADGGHRPDCRGRDAGHHLRRDRPLRRRGLCLCSRRRWRGLHQHGQSFACADDHPGRGRPAGLDQRPAHHQGTRAALHRHVGHDGHRPGSGPDHLQRHSHLRAGRQLQVHRPGQVLRRDPGAHGHRAGGLCHRLWSS